MNLTSLGVSEIRSLVAAKEVKAEEVVRAFLQQIGEREPAVAAFLSVEAEKALEQAKALDRKKEKGCLAGVPIAVKDNILVKGLRATCGSRILENYVAPYSATAIEKLAAEDAIFIGKTNLDEFGMGSSTENSAFWVTRNPWDLSRVPGGSSGGSAAAVAAGEAAAALGSDTGGSVRQPAAFCGVVGLKPTYSRVSRYGLIAFASSFDQIGPLTRTVEDCALLTRVISGPDGRDSTLADRPVPDFLKEMKEKRGPFKAAHLKEKLIERIDPDVKDIYWRTLNSLRDLGGELVEMDFPLWEYALPCYYIIAPSEASSNLARYDGVRYGLRSPDHANLQEMYFKTRTSGFGEEVKRRILLGTFALSSGYYDAYYLKAGRTRQQVSREFERAFAVVDYIITPTAPEPAFPIGTKKDPIAMYLSDVFTVSANLAGCPAISLPCGWSRKGLPVGLQVIGNHFQEGRIFQLAFLLEKKVKFENNKNITDWKEER
jgi:aspartyl-tRNA(Asn)/glutamyl-tRNA(Gln) amidotransferase subunit A